ncbi:hypothetical protein Trydic_g5900 [Trypoxylus dichotomus]
MIVCSWSLSPRELSISSKGYNFSPAPKHISHIITEDCILQHSKPPNQNVSKSELAALKYFKSNSNISLKEDIITGVKSVLVKLSKTIAVPIRYSTAPILEQLYPPKETLSKFELSALGYLKLNPNIFPIEDIITGEESIPVKLPQTIADLIRCSTGFILQQSKASKSELSALKPLQSNRTSSY